MPYRAHAAQTIIVGLPLYNEGESIEVLLERIPACVVFQEMPVEIVVYDDGSTDDTLEKCRTFQSKFDKLHIIEGGVNKGLGAGVQALIDYTLDHFKEQSVLVLMDGDNTHNPEHIFDLIHKIRSGFDVVVASRYQKDSRVVGVSRFRRLLTLGHSFIFRTLFPTQGIRDYSCGYRAYTHASLRQARERYGSQLVTRNDFSCMVEVLLKLRKLDLLFCETPLVLRYDWKGGPSKMRVGATVLRTLQLAFKRV